VSLEIRHIVEADLPAVLDLIDGLADYEKLPRPDAAARDRLAADAFADPPRFHVLVADARGTLIGYAFYFYTYSTFLARPTLYLEDIFVLPEWRGQRAGIALFRACTRAAVERGCGRMDWQVLTWNQPSIDFYKRLGARQMDDWYSFRLDGSALAAVAGSGG